MSYYMNIVRCDLIRTTSKSIDEIDETYINWDWDEGNDGVKPSEDYFKWGDGEFINDLVKLAKMDVVGEVVTRGDEGEIAKYVLEGGEVNEYYGDVVFPDEPNEVHTEVKQSVVITA